MKSKRICALDRILCTVFVVYVVVRSSAKNESALGAAVGRRRASAQSVNRWEWQQTELSPPPEHERVVLRQCTSEPLAHEGALEVPWWHREGVAQVILRGPSARSFGEAAGVLGQKPARL